MGQVYALEADMKYSLLGAYLLLSGCATSVEQTLENTKMQCNDEGTNVKAVVKNIDGVESLKVTCEWVVPLF